MKTKFSKEMLTVIKSKKFDGMVINFSAGMARLFSLEKVRGQEVKMCYSWQFEKSTNEAGCVHISRYDDHNILGLLIKPDTDVYFHIVVSGTDPLKQAGFTWEFLRITCNNISVQMSHLISNNRHKLSDDRIDWSGEPLNEWRVY